MEDIYSVVIDGNDINAIDGVEVLNHNFNDLPRRNIRQNEIARADKSVITSADYVEKAVSINLEVCGGTRLETEGLLTFLKSLMQRINMPVKVLQSNSEYQYTATLNEFNIEWDGITALVTVVLIAANPIGYETQATVLLSETITQRTATFSRLIGGSFRAQPIFTLTINSVTGGTDGSITIRNTNTGQGITLSDDFVNGDSIIINSVTLKANINGQNVDFAGMFPTYGAGTRGIGYSDTFTTRNVSLSASYVKRIV